MGKVVLMIALILAAIGAINWGLVGLFEFDLVAAITGAGDFGEMNTLSQIIYVVVGVAGIVSLAALSAIAKARDAEDVDDLEEVRGSGSVAYPTSTERRTSDRERDAA